MGARGGGGGSRVFGISRGTEEIAIGILRGELKTMWNFQGFSRKNHVEFPVQGSWYYALKFVRGVTQFCGVSRN